MTITDSMVLQFRSIGKVPRTTVPPAVYSQRFPNMDRPMRLIVLSLLLSAVSAAPLMAAETAPPAAASPLVIGETFTIGSKALGETAASMFTARSRGAWIEGAAAGAVHGRWRHR